LLPQGNVTTQKTGICLLFTNPKDHVFLVNEFISIKVFQTAHSKGNEPNPNAHVMGDTKGHVIMVGGGTTDHFQHKMQRKSA
jgi:hypothetical protein